MFDNIREVIDYVRQTGCKSHICVCNTAVFDKVLEDGVYGFPTGGAPYTKSFIRAFSSLYNIGKDDLIFIYRMNGLDDNCKEIHGPFQICTETNGQPMIYYEKDSAVFPLQVGKSLDVDCPMRFMFKRITAKVYSISDHFKLIEKYENKAIWGYRHPAVMNIGAARKKSISSFTNKSTLELLDLLNNQIVKSYPLSIPSATALSHYANNPNITKFNELYLMDNAFYHLCGTYNGNVKDEAFLYAYLLSAFCANNGSAISAQAINDFNTLNSSLNIKFKDFLANSMLEVILSPHLQDEMDVVLQTADDSSLLFIELKKGLIDQDAIDQAKRYIDLLQSIFPAGKKAYANIIGSGIEQKATIPTGYSNKIKLVTYRKTAANGVSFS